MSMSMSENGLHVSGTTCVNGAGFLVHANNTAVVGSGGYGTTRHNVVQAVSYGNTTSRIHIKTLLRHASNATHGSLNEMYRVRIHGYGYGSSLPIDTVCVGYVYAGGNSLSAQGVSTRPNCATVTQYMSSDGYLTFTVYASAYYTTVNLDWERNGGNGTLRDSGSILSVTYDNSNTI